LLTLLQLLLLLQMTLLQLLGLLLVLLLELLSTGRIGLGLQQLLMLLLLLLLNTLALLLLLSLQLLLRLQVLPLERGIRLSGRGRSWRRRQFVRMNRAERPVAPDW
jgi:hypothetical protein